MDLDLLVLLADLDGNWSLAVRLPAFQESVAMRLQSLAPVCLQRPLLRRDGRHGALQPVQVCCLRFRWRCVKKRRADFEKEG